MIWLKKIFDWTFDILETVAFVGSLFIVVYLFILRPHKVQGMSMFATFHDGDYILTSKLSFRFQPPRVGDVVVFKSPGNKDIEYIKRIIGLPGDRVMVKSGEVILNGKTLNENYNYTKTFTFDPGFMREGVEILVPNGYVVAMGDNRNGSSDSRIFGPVPMDEIVGKVFYRYLPPNRIGKIENPYQK